MAPALALLPVLQGGCQVFYETEEFSPALSFTVAVDSGWRLAYSERSDYFELTTAEEVLGTTYPGLGFYQVGEVYPPNCQHLITFDPQDRTTTAPADMVTWLRNHPLLEVSKLVPVTVGGTEGMRLDVSVAPGLEDTGSGYSTECGPVPCVLLLRRSADEGGLGIWADQKNRLIVLDDVDGKTVIIHISSDSPERFGGVLPKAQVLLDTVEWTGVS